MHEEGQGVHRVYPVFHAQVIEGLAGVFCRRPGCSEHRVNKRGPDGWLSFDTCTTLDLVSWLNGGHKVTDGCYTDGRRLACLSLTCSSGRKLRKDPVFMICANRRGPVFRIGEIRMQEVPAITTFLKRLHY